ncbi:MAG: hypothetical protein K6G55_08115 [Selenomonadaceae bacterium]|nr:hypothetical protein [Selenomonadaceae bacterium]
MQTLINKMKAANGKKVFFILANGFPFGILQQAGFTFNKDFVNGFDFLSEANGIQLNSYEMIKNM